MAGKEFVITSRGYLRCVIRGGYSSTLESIQKLVDIAMTDFPALKAWEIDVKVYAGERHKRMMGVEFNLYTPVIVPLDYEPMHELDNTYN